MQTHAQHRTVRFGAFEADLRAGQLRKRGIRLRLAGQPLTILEMLLAQPGEIVTRDELQARLWPQNTFVEFDHSLNAAVNKLREVLGDSADEPRYIETVPRRGYRFIAELLPSDAPASVATTSDNGAGAAAAEPASLDAAKFPRLSWAAGLVVIAVVASLATWAILKRPATVEPAPPAPPPIRALAVLPFDNLSNDPRQEYFADGMTDALISQLAQIGALRVISRTSVMQYRGERQSLPEIARALNVDAVVEGAVLRSGDRVRISAQLIRASTDEHLWAESYERDLTDILKLQSEVARTIAQRIRVSVTAEEQARLAAAPPVNAEAYKLYLQGRYFQNKRTGPNTVRAIEFLEEATRKDPNYALAHVALAESSIFGYPPQETMPRAKAAAERALALDPNLAEAHAARGTVQMFWEWDWEGARRSLDRALQLNPGDVLTHQSRCTYFAVRHRFEEAIAACQRALELDPRAADVSHQLGRVYYFARQYDRAAAQLEHTAELDPNHYWAPFFLALVRERQGRFDEAYRAWERSLVLSGARPEQLAEVASTYAQGGYPALLRRRIGWMERSAGEGPLVSSDLALLNASLGNKEEALRWLQRSFASHTRDLIYLGVEPQYDVLRQDPRFAAFLRKLNLPAKGKP